MSTNDFLFPKKKPDESDEMFSGSEDNFYTYEYEKDNNREPSMVRWKSGKRVDPRLLTLLEFFREIYVKRREFFKKIFPASYEDFVHVFKKTGRASMRNREVRSFRTIGRSLSLGDSPRLERFKVRTPKVVVAGENGKGDQSGQADTGSKDTKK